MSVELAICDLPKRLGIAETENDLILKDVLEIWGAVYFEELGWFDKFDDSLLRDGYQDRACYLVAQDKMPIGTLRIIVGNSAHPVPIQRFADISHFVQTGKIAEFTRVMVNPDQRKRESPLFPFGVYRALMRTAIQWCVLNGIWTIAMNVRARGEPNSIINTLIPYGFEETGIMISDEFDGQNPLCTACILDVRQIFQKFYLRQDRLVDYTMTRSVTSQRNIVALNHVRVQF